MSTAAPASTPAAPESKPRTLWDRAFAITPVVLTLLGTSLAGLSSSEMTRAQYHRALAAQHQGKVSDQWNLFQFKRTRRALGEQTVELAGGGATPVDPVYLQTTASRIALLLRRGAKQTQTLTQHPSGRRSDDRTASEGGDPAYTHFHVVAERQAERAEKTAQAFRKELSRPELRDDLGYLGMNKLPPFQEQPITHPDVLHALELVQTGQRDAQAAAELAHLSDEHLRDAIATAEANVRAVEESGKQTDRRLRALDKLVERHRQAVQAFHRAAQTLDQAALDTPGQNKGDTAAVRRLDHALAGASDELRAYRVAREDFNARRNAREADQHQKASLLYEVQVAKSGVTADRYRQRSALFFYGMLLAQAGAAIASLAMAARQQSLLWALAGV